MTERYTVAVRTLCEFTARTGDIDLRFAPSPTAQQGIAGHQLVAARRGAGFEAELALAGDWEDLTVRGRADGFDAVRGRLEEVKTHRADLARQPASQRALHWAQLQVYGWLLCRSRGLERLTLALVYLHLGTQQETVFTRDCSADELRDFFEAQCRLFRDWARQELAHARARDAALVQLAFPYPDFRAGQRTLAEAAYRAAVHGRCLAAQAPTGIGKTLATLFPLLKAWPGQRLDKLLFLAAKTPGRQLALHALAQLRAGGALPLRVLELTAREKACEHPDKACHGESCPLARGFHDRLPAARSAALAQPATRESLRATAAAHQVCPYWLAQELVAWADVVVGDYNYYFDGNALLHAVAQEHGWRCALLVDEAHNLLERGRQMYSAALSESPLRALRRTAPALLRRPLERLARAWRALVRGQQVPWQEHAELPGGLVQALQQAAAAIADQLAEGGPEPKDALQQFFFDALAFARLAESFGTHSMFDVTVEGTGRGRSTTLTIRNLLPAPFLAPRFAAAHCSVLFSATLGPAAFCRDTLGLPADSLWLDVPSPFSAEQLAVRLVPGISTRWAGRERSVAPIARLIAQHWRAAPGNYLAFFSSYDYLQQVAQALSALGPDIPVWLQSPGMREAEREAFLARFQPGGAGVGFAVLGGPFAEGIDLPGDRLVGAFIATLGLPQPTPVNERLRERMQQAYGAGYDYAYLVPGLRKVVQAAGRVIRSTEDRGTVVLIDDRFTRAEVRALLPAWWRPAVAIAPPE